MILNKNRNQALKGVNRNGLSLKYVLQELRNDREIVLAAVTQNGMALQKKTSKKIRNDLKIVIAAVKQNNNALSYVNKNSYNSWNNKKIYLL